MSLELVKERILIGQTAAEEEVQTVFENDIIVPDVKPDVARIVEIDGEAVVTGTEAVQDKIMVSGFLRYNILYSTDNPEDSIKSINTNSNFSYNIEASGIKAGMNSRAKCEIEHISYEILNGRKINVKTILNVSGKGINEIDKEIIQDLREIEDIQVLKSSVNVNMFVGTTSEVCRISENLEVPAGKPSIREILRSNIKCTEKEYKVTENKVIVKGELCVSTLYISDEDGLSVHAMEHELPFSQLVDIPGVSEDSNCEVNYLVNDSRFEPMEDSDGEVRLVNGEIEINILVDGYSKRKIEFLSDAYSPKVRINFESESINIEDLITDNNSQAVIKDNIYLRGEKPEIVEIYNILSKPSLTSYDVQDDKILIEGIVKNNILYLSESANEKVNSIEHESAFKQAVDLRGIKKDMNANVELEAQHSSFSMLSSSEIEVRIVVGINIRVKNQLICSVIHKVTECPIDDKRFENQPSIIIYFSQAGDNLWRIAKKYYTTIDEIQKINNFTDRDLITPGQQIIIPKRIV